MWFTFHTADRRVTCFYFYLWDEDFVPAFTKICAYFPYPAKVWLDGHEWAKRQTSARVAESVRGSGGLGSRWDPP